MAGQNPNLVPPPPAPGSAPAKRLASSSEFARAIKRQYPGVYDDIHDDALTHIVLTKYPQYRDAAVDIYEGIEGVALPQLPAGAKPAPPPNPDSLVHDNGILDDVKATVRGLGNMAFRPGNHDQDLADAGQAFGSVVRGGVRLVEGAKTAGAMLNQMPNDQGVIGPPPGVPLPKPSAQEIAQPFADIVGGAMEAGELGLIPAAIAAPWATAAALGVGTVATEGTRMGLEAVGAPPAVAELGGDVAGLVAGGVAAHKVTARQSAATEARLKGDQDFIAGAEAQRAEVRDLLRAEDEAAMQVEFADETGRVTREQQAEGLYQDWQQKKEDAFAALAVNRGLLELAKAHAEAGRARVRGPFDYLDEAANAARGSVAMLEAAQEGRAQTIVDPTRMLPQMAETRPVAHVEGPPADYLGEQVPAPAGPGAPPPPPDTTPRLVDDVVGQFERMLNPPTEDPVVAEARMRAEASRQAAYDMASELDDNLYEKGGGGQIGDGVVTDAGVEGTVFANAAPNAKLYRAIVGEDNKNPPPGRLIADLLQIYAETGAKTSAEVPKARFERMRQERVHESSRHYGPRALPNAYDRWMPEILRVHRARTSRRLSRLALDAVLEQERLAQEAVTGRLVDNRPPQVPDEGADFGPFVEEGLIPENGEIVPENSAAALADDVRSLEQDVRPLEALADEPEPDFGLGDEPDLSVAEGWDPELEGDLPPGAPPPASTTSTTPLDDFTQNHLREWVARMVRDPEVADRVFEVMRAAAEEDPSYLDRGWDALYRDFGREAEIAAEAEIAGRPPALVVDNAPSHAPPVAAAEPRYYTDEEGLARAIQELSGGNAQAVAGIAEVHGSPVKQTAYQLLDSLRRSKTGKYRQAAIEYGRRLLEAAEEAGTATEDDVPLPGLESVRDVENPTPQEDLSFSLEREPVREGGSQQGDLFEPVDDLGQWVAQNVTGKGRGAVMAAMRDHLAENPNLAEAPARLFDAVGGDIIEAAAQQGLDVEAARNLGAQARELYAERERLAMQSDNPMSDPAYLAHLEKMEPTLEAIDRIRYPEHFAPIEGDSPQQSLWDALKSDATDLLTDEEGALKFNVDPNSRSAVLKWMERQARDYSHEPWYEAAQQALEEGDLPSAVRIISIASAQSHMAEAATLRRDPEKQATVAVIEDAIERTRQAHRARIETQLGIPLPKTVDVSPEGILLFQPSGKGVPAVRARATDLNMARSLANDVVAQADPTQIIRMGLSGEVDPQFQVSKQLADQVVNEFPDEFISDMAELMGFEKLSTAEQRIEIGRQFARTYSNAGKLLGELGRWAQANEDAFYKYGAVNETGKIGELGSVGALQASGITTPEGFVQWLGKAATPEQLAEMKFQLPRGIELKNAKGELTPEAKLFGRNWFRRNQRLHEIQTTIDRLVGEQGNALDRAIAATTIAPQTTTDGQGRLGALTSLTKAALISRPGTMIRNAISQSGRYASGMADEALASFFSLATGDTKQATLHARNLRYLTQGLTRKGASSLNLLKHPWEDGLQAIYDFTEATLATLPASDARKTLALLSEVPHEEIRYLGSLSLEGIKPDEPGQLSRIKPLAAMQKALDQITRPEVRNTLTILNRVQEHFFRSAIFDAMLRAQIESKGLNPMEVLAGDPRQLIDRVGIEEFDRMAGAAVSAALDYTFAADPLPGTAPAKLLEVFQKTPVLSFLLQLGMPFPRFNFVSAPRWVWDHTPIAPVGDLMMLGLSALRQDSSPMFRGRLHQMLQVRRAEATMLDLDTQIARGKYDAAIALSDFMAAKDGQRQAGAVLKQVEAGLKKAGTPGLLEGASTELARIQGEAARQQEAAVRARMKWKEVDQRVKNLEQQRDRAQRTHRDLAAVGAAKSPQEYFARIATGTAMMGAGYALWQWKATHSSTPGSPDTQWYELPMTWLPKEAQRLAGVEGQTIDLRSFAPEVQQFFLPDVLADVQAHTDWSQLDPTRLGDLHYISEFMRDHYSGKYTSQKFTKDALEAYLTISPAAGSTRDLMDILTGRADNGQGGGLDPAALQDVLLSMAGQYIGRLSSPLGVVNDAVGQFSAEDRKARIPREGTDEHYSVFQSLFDPTIANIPGLRREIPEKIDALSGQAVGSVDPLARQFGGITKRLQNRVQQEINATGLSYSQAVPRQTGDREFDNEVNRQYSAILREYMPQILEDPAYLELTAAQKRDVLANGIPGRSGVFPMMKKLALQRAIEALEKDPETLRSPEAQAKITRWQQYVVAHEAELAPQTEATERVLNQEEPEPGAPPSLEFDSGAPPQFP